MHILIAEDDAVCRELLRRIIESEQKHTLEMTVDGESAWTQLSDQSKSFDLCILDILMPQGDGLEIVRRMRAHPKLKATPVMLCTAATDRATVQRAAGLSIASYIAKPYSRSLVIDKLRQFEAARPIETAPQGEALQNSPAICQQLGIDATAYRVLLQAMIRETQAWMSHLIRPNLRAPDAALLLSRVEPLKAAFACLGAVRVGQQLAALKSAAEGFAAAGQASASKIAPLLERLDKELALVVVKLDAVPAAAQ